MDRIQLLTSIKEIDSQRQRHEWLNVVILLTLLALVFFLVPVGLRRVPHTMIGSIFIRHLIFDFVLVAVAFGYIAYLAWVKRRLSQNLSLICPHCAKPFRDQDLARMGYTETCAACGKQIFDGTGALQSSRQANLESEPKEGGIVLRTRDEFLKLDQDFRKGEGYKIDRITILLAAGILIPMSCVLLIPVGKNGDIVELVLRSFLVLCCMVGIFGYAHFARQRAAHRFGLSCPSCQHIFNPREFKYLGYSGQCQRCNTPLIH